jgi:hypothetical protein
VVDVTDLLRANLLSPVVLCFALGIVAKLLRSELALPKDIYAALGIYLLFAIGLKGGAALRHASLAAIAWPVAATLALGVVTPISTYVVMRRLGRFGAADSAAMAAHYGSVSAVTFIAAQQFAAAMGTPAEGYLATLLTLLESPGITIALAIGALRTADAGRARSAVLHEVLTGRSMVLLVGGLCIGTLMTDAHRARVAPVYEGLFTGVLMLFLLEMGIVAAARLGDLRKVGGFLLAFGMALPLVHGVLGVLLGHAAGLSVGGAAVLGTMAASASYIAAPPAVRLVLPQANPTYYLTCALGITFPFNLVVGIPLYHQVAAWLAR